MEALRIEKTDLSQIEFAVRCGIPHRTYQRWIYGDTDARPTMPQLKAMSRLLGIKSIEDLPDDFGPPVRSQPIEEEE